jgi:hypothetical protein
MNEFAHATLFAAEALVLALVWLYANRARRHADRAVVAAAGASLSKSDAERHADRAESLLPPDVIPFPEHLLRRNEIPPPVVTSVPGLLRIFDDLGGADPHKSA